jgi:hypothetical protein
MILQEVCISLGYELIPRVNYCQGQEFFPSVQRPEKLWGPFRLLANGGGDKAVGA